MTLRRSTAISSLTRRRALALGAVAGGLTLAPRYAAAVVRLDITEGNFQPMPIAIAKFIGGGDRRRRYRDGRHPDHHREPATQRPVRPDRSRRLYRNHRQRRRGAAVSRLARHQRAGARHRRRHAAERRPAQGRIPALGRARRPAACRPAIFHHARQLAPHRPHHLGRDLRAAHRQRRLFRQPRRVRRRNRAGDAAHQAARHHGSGRRQCALSHARRRTRAHAAVLAFDAGDHLHGLRPGRSARLSLQYRDRPARNRRQFSRHELLAAVFAGRPARHHEFAGRRELQHLRHGFALEGDDAADRHPGDRHLARPIRPTVRRFASNPIAAASRRSTSWPRPAGRRSASASATAPIRRRSGRRAATTSPSPRSRKTSSRSA